MKLSKSTPPEGTVRDWLDARARAGGTAVTFPETRGLLTWHQLRAEARQIAGDLTARGIAKGDSAAVIHPNGREGVIALYAALYGGFRATMINLAAGPDAIGYALEHSEAKIAFVHPDQMEMFQSVRPEGLEPYEAEEEASEADLHDLTASDDALLMYTSGTTGRPKGVVHTHSSLLAGGWTTAIAHDLGPGDRGFCVLPSYHITVTHWPLM